MTQLPFRLGVGLMIINDKAQVFVGKRVDSKNEFWQMPQGGIDENELPSKAAFREMKEEIGTDLGTILCETKGWYSYNIPDFLIPRLWNGQYCGQKQKWFLIKYTGSDDDIKIDYDSKPEFIEWKWSEMQDLPNIIIPFKRDLYISVIEEFRDHILEIKKIINKI
jgi:putative (di)nucleoside polyphosphate hydrolase